MCAIGHHRLPQGRQPFSGEILLPRGGRKPRCSRARISVRVTRRDVTPERSAHDNRVQAIAPEEPAVPSSRPRPRLVTLSKPLQERLISILLVCALERHCAGRAQGTFLLFPCRPSCQSDGAPLPALPSRGKGAESQRLIVMRVFPQNPLGAARTRLPINVRKSGVPRPRCPRCRGEKPVPQSVQ